MKKLFMAAVAGAGLLCAIQTTASVTLHNSNASWQRGARVESSDEFFQQGILDAGYVIDHAYAGYQSHACSGVANIREKCRKYSKTYLDGVNFRAPEIGRIFTPGETQAVLSTTENSPAKNDGITRGEAYAARVLSVQYSEAWLDKLEAIRTFHRWSQHGNYYVEEYVSGLKEGFKTKIGNTKLSTPMFSGNAY